MTEQDFNDAGAECVGGDLILNRVVVGRYRSGQFVPTEDGLLMDVAPPPPTLDPAHPAAAPVAPVAAVKAPKATKAKAAAVVPTEPVAPETPTTPPLDPLAELDGLPAM